jgi:predicted Zn-dependent protease
MEFRMRPFLVVFVLVLSCSRPPSAALPDPTCVGRLRLEIDSLFVPGEMAEILEAVSNWERASGGRMCVEVVRRDASADSRSFQSDGRFAIYSWRGGWQVEAATTAEDSPCRTRASCLGVTIWERGGRTSDIFVLTGELAFMRATVEHELGHMFGLGHTPVYESIMFRTIRPDKAIGRIDRRNLGCLLETRAFLRNANGCNYVR